MPTFIVERRHDTWEVSDADGEVAFFGFDHEAERWWICANTDRYPTNGSLPACFGERFHHYVEKFGECFRFFGLDLPRVPRASAEVAALTEAA